MRIVLFGEMVLGIDLSLEEGNMALEAANRNKKLQGQFTFYLTNKYSRIGLWSLCAREEAMRRDFVNNPDDYVIEVPE